MEKVNKTKSKHIARLERVADGFKLNTALKLATIKNMAIESLRPVKRKEPHGEGK